MNFVPLQSLIPRAAASKGIAKEFKAISVCSAFESILPEVFAGHPTIKNEVRVRFYKDGILTIGVSSSIVASELTIKKQKILSLLNEKLSASTTPTTIKNIKTTVY